MAIAQLQSAEAAKFVDALEFSASGTTLTVTASLPGDSLVEIAKQRTPQLAGMRLPAPPTMRGAHRASAQMCMYHIVAMHSANERYYFDAGEWPTKIDQLIKYAPDSPNFCEAHQMHYTIDPDTHRVTETDSLDEAADPVSLAADSTASSTTTPSVTDSPRGAFEHVAFAARDGDVGRLLDGFTEAGKAEIAADLTGGAEEAVALHSHQLPEVAREFRQLQTEKSPAHQERTSEPPTRTELDYLLSIASFMKNHRIEFSSLAGIYEPCVLGDIVSEDKWAVGRVTYDKDGVVRGTTLGFVRDAGNWRICTLSEIPTEVCERLLAGLEG